MNPLYKVTRLSAAERGYLLEAYLVLWLIQVMIWGLPFRRWWALLSRMTHIRRAAALDSKRVDQLMLAIKRAQRGVPRATCLPQALAAQAMLARRGQISDLRIGVVYGGDGRLLAHAWVISDSRVVIGQLPDLARYQLLPLRELKNLNNFT
ncbi:MAG: lasso peptide biosynthesis B2 protein [Chloroflexi bacterium]|nr:lasso peptide biosynthesis B2 protein [Chloroflexota bacterium]